MSKTGLSPLDPSSFSRPELAVVTHLNLNLSVNFDAKVLTGDVTLFVKKLQNDVSEVILDSSKLNISSVIDLDSNLDLSFTLSEYLEDYGSKLTIQLPKSGNDSFKINIKYETSPDASGLQWLSPKATSGKKLPFMFSQFQPIHARSVIPCQDTPAVKTKYNATISASQEFTVLMSAISHETKILQSAKLSHFIQDVPVPSYLIALAVGALESKKLGPRSHVWAEKEIIDACAYEFADTEHQLRTAEEICGDYVWGVYDLLVLPPSFPYGGMENPCLTFVTPTLLAGDRSLANVIAHEIAHSWTGNLITNRNFEHFWLNEGFTVFIERKIKGRLESAQAQDFEAYTAVSELNETINRIGKDSPLTNLVVDLKGVHPDDAFSTVPYEKGQTFLRYLETLVGGPDQFEPFLLSYFNNFKYKSIETDDFKNFFLNHFKNHPVINDINWNLWLHTPGMPPIIPDYDKTLAIFCDSLLKKILEWDGNGNIPITDDDKSKLTTHQKIYFLQKILDSKNSQTVQKLEALETLFNFDSVKNSEIKFLWLRICLKAKWEDKVHMALTWINIVGRMKFVRPLYRDLYDWEMTRQKAIENFMANRRNMMHICAHVVAKDLHLKE